MPRTEPDRRFHCRNYDPERWFPTGYGPTAAADTVFAVAVCGLCPSQTACLAWALDQGVEFGIWGGKTEDERRIIRRRGALRGTENALHPTHVDALVG